MSNYRGVHDIGGLPGGEVVPSEHDYALWEKRVDAMMVLLSKKGLMTVDELRRNIEGLGADAYDKMTYYERWIAAVDRTGHQRKRRWVPRFSSVSPRSWRSRARCWAKAW